MLLLGCAPAESTLEDGDNGGAAPIDKLEASEMAAAGRADGMLDICKRRSWYHDGNCDRFCVVFGEPDIDDCVAQPNPSKTPRSVTRFPIVLVHGFNSSPSFLGFLGVAEALRAEGFSVFVTQSPPFAGTHVRATGPSKRERGECAANDLSGECHPCSGSLRTCVDFARQETGSARVHIVAHSLGGLDARLLVSSFGYASRVASITTISAPHHGTGIADFFLRVLAQGRAAETGLVLLGKFLGFAYDTSTDIDAQELRRSFTDLSEGGAAARNQTTTDARNVYYQSWAGVSQIPLPDMRSQDAAVKRACTTPTIFQQRPITDSRVRAPFYYGLENKRDVLGPTYLGFAPFIAAIDTPHDGFVRVDSAKWGVFRGCIPADHTDEVGMPFFDKPYDLDTGFHRTWFYIELARDLARAESDGRVHN